MLKTHESVNVYSVMIMYTAYIFLGEMKSVRGVWEKEPQRVSFRSSAESAE